MLRSRLESLFESAAAALATDRSALPAIEIAEPRDLEHGDFACNFALAASKALGKPPRDVAAMLVDAIPANDLIASTEIAGPGFINIRLKPEAIAACVDSILKLGPEGLASSQLSSSSKLNINLEFVSVNPNGPITVGSGRGAAFGSALGNVLEAAGHSVHREYYVNDGTNSEQMRLFAESVQKYVSSATFNWIGPRIDSDLKHIRSIEIIDQFLTVLGPGRGGFDPSWFEAEFEQFLTNCAGKHLGPIDQHVIQDFRLWLQNAVSDPYRIGMTFKGRYEQCFATGSFVAFELVPELLGYKGDYVKEVALQIMRTSDRRDLLKNSVGDSGIPWFQAQAENWMIQSQQFDLALFEVIFETWFSEQSIHDSGTVTQCVDELIAKGAADEEPKRFKVKFAKGGVIDDVEEEKQVGNVTDEGDDESEPTGTNPNQPELSTLWLRSTKFGDDMDRVLRRKDGRLTYIASDVAYHKDKFKRGSKPDANGKVEPADKLITILGPDHHGYIGRLHAVVGALLEESEPPNPQSSEPLSEFEEKIYKSPAERDACLAALAESREKLEVVIFQIVRFVKDGKPAPMRKRDGNIYSLRDLMAEIGRTAAPNEPEEEQMRIGKDVARFFYLMRSHDTHMDFDIDLATKQSDENPVFYCQYAHARICSVIRKAEEAGFSAEGGAVSALQDQRELTLIKKILELPFEVARCAEDYGVHRLTTFAIELARTYHAFYDVCRVIQPDQPELTRARLALCEATKVGLQAVFNLLGVSAPERMDREQMA